MPKTKKNMTQHNNKNENSFFKRWERQIHYAWKNVFNDFRQHIFASLLTIFVIAISITLPIVCYLLWKNANMAANQWDPTPNLTLYLSKSLSLNETTNLKNAIEAYPEVEQIKYLSRDETREEFRLWSGFSNALDLLDENPLPAVMIVIPNDNAKNTDLLHALQTKFLNIAGVDDVRLDDSWFTRLTALTGMIKQIVWIISIFMVIAVFLVIGNSIRLMIFARRQTIIVMKLIGATEGFILRPFLYNGLFIGFISAVVALLFSSIFIFQIDSIILSVSSIFGTMFDIKGLTFEEMLLIIMLSMVIGWLSAFIATKKYLKHNLIN